MEEDQEPGERRKGEKKNIAMKRVNIYTKEREGD